MKRLIFSIFVLALAQPALAQTKPAQPKSGATKPGTTLKKCQDAKGATYYYDKTFPPECEQADVTEMSTKGVVKKTISAPPTEEEKKAKADEALHKQDEAKKAEQQARRDRALLDTYTEEREIDLARDRNLQANEAALKNAQLRLKSAQAKLAQSRQQADSVAKQGNPRPDWLAEELAGNEKELKRVQEDLAARQKEQDTIRARFDADKQRFRELKAQRQVAPAQKR